jgi:transposase
MTREYALDFRERLLAAQDAGLAAAEIERTFGVPRRTQRRWRQWQRERGSLADRPRAGRPRVIAGDQEAALRAQVAAHPDVTLAEHCRLWVADHGVAVSEATMCRRLRDLGLPLKQRPGSHANAMRPSGQHGGRASGTAIRPTLSSSTRRARP